MIKLWPDGVVYQILSLFSFIDGFKFADLWSLTKPIRKKHVVVVVWLNENICKGRRIVQHVAIGRRPVLFLRRAQNCSRIQTIGRRAGWFCSAVKISACFQGVFPCALFPIPMQWFLKSFLSSRNVGNQFWELGRAFICAGWLVASFQSLGIEESGWLLGLQLEEASLLNWKAELHQNYKEESRCKGAK